MVGGDRTINGGTGVEEDEEEEDEDEAGTEAIVDIDREGSDPPSVGEAAASGGSWTALIGEGTWVRVPKRKKHEITGGAGRLIRSEMKLYLMSSSSSSPLAGSDGAPPSRHALEVICEQLDLVLDDYFEVLARWRAQKLLLIQGLETGFVAIDETARQSRYTLVLNASFYQNKEDMETVFAVDVTRSTKNERATDVLPGTAQDVDHETRNKQEGAHEKHVLEPCHSFDFKLRMHKECFQRPGDADTTNLSNVLSALSLKEGNKSKGREVTSKGGPRESTTREEGKERHTSDSVLRAGDNEASKDAESLRLKPSKDPLYWISACPPPPLVEAQGEFKACLAVATAVASLQTRLYTLHTRLELLHQQKQNAVAAAAAAARGAVVDQEQTTPKKDITTAGTSETI